jgi:outer membrane protein assembly factor BamB
MSISVLTRAFDNTRSGANTAESALTAAAVKTGGVRRLFSLALPGDARGIEAQPLVVAGVTMDDGTQRDVIYLATMANQVWAFDMSDGTLLWERTLCRPVDGSVRIDEYAINDHWGILSTPVIDAGTGTMYLVTWTSADGSVDNAQHWVHAISIVDGRPVQPPCNLEGATFDPGHGQPVQQFRSAARKQRASLVLTAVAGTKVLLVPFASLYESEQTARGWIIACSLAPLAVTAAWAATARGSGGGVWQAAAGLAADADGYVYAMTGNGGFDALTDWSESFVKLQYTPPKSGAATGSLSVVDWWTPWCDDGRVGLDPSGDEEGKPTPTNLRAYTIDVNAGWDDMDLGSGGPVLVPKLGIVVGAGKDGILYAVRLAAMGKTQPSDLNAPAANYGKLAIPPTWFTYYPAGLDSAPNDISTLNLLYANRTHHQHGSPVFWDGPDHGPMLFCWGENGNLRAWSISQGSIQYLACGAEVASAQASVPPGGMPGGMLCLSANGTEPHTGVLWACIPYNDANKMVSPGRLLAYDASQFGAYPDGSGQLNVLWDSQDWNIAYSHNKFCPPVVANGKLIVPTYDGRVDVYGL